MSKKQSIRLIVDISMFILLFTVMGYNLIGNTLHEWMGIALFALFITHIYLNWNCIKSIFKGKYNIKRSGKLLINLLLFISCLLLLFFSMPISSTVFPFVSFLAEEMYPAQIHILTGNWLFLLIAMHLGAQWHRVKSIFSNLPKAIKSTLIILVHLCGIYGINSAIQRNFFEKLIMYFTFDFGRANDSALLFFFDYFSIFALFALLGYWLLGTRKQ